MIAYWSSAYCGIILVEHLVFRKGDAASYRHAVWNKRRELPSVRSTFAPPLLTLTISTQGIPALAAGLLSLALIVPSMEQVWFTGPIAKHTGDIGFEVAFAIAALLYWPLRKLDLRFGGRL